MRLDKMCINLSNDLISSPRLEAKVFVIIDSIHLLFYLFIPNNGLYCRV